MKKHFSDEQMISILREAEAGFGLGVLPQACYFSCHLRPLPQHNWRHPDVKQFESLEEENARLAEAFQD